MIAKRRPVFAGEELGAPLMSEAALAHARDGETPQLNSAAIEPTLPPHLAQVMASHTPDVAEKALPDEWADPQDAALVAPSSAPLHPAAESRMPLAVETAQPAPSAAHESFADMIARLERGLAARAAVSPALVPNVPEVSEPMTKSVIAASTSSENEQLLAQAMNKLGGLVGGRK